MCSVEPNVRKTDDAVARAALSVGESLAIALVAFVAIVYAITIVKLQGGA